MSKPIRILCFGDSNTYGANPYAPIGTRYDLDVIWPSIVQKKLGEGYVVINEGLNGRTTAFDRPNREDKNGLTSLPGILGQHAPVDIISIMLGTNDALVNLGLSAAQITAGMEKLIDCVEEITPQTQGFVPKIIIVSPAATRPEFRDSPNAEMIDEYTVQKSHEIAPLYAELAQARGCAYVNATEDVEVSPLDSQHLTYDGHAQLAELMYQAYLDILQ